MKFYKLILALAEGGFAIYGTAEVRDFVRSLPEEVREKVQALVRSAAIRGLPRNREKCKKLRGDIYELKSFQVRLAFMYGPRRRTLLMLHGIIKKSNDWPKNEVKVVTRVESETTFAIQKGTIIYVD